MIASKAEKFFQNLFILFLEYLSTMVFVRDCFKFGVRPVIQALLGQFMRYGVHLLCNYNLLYIIFILHFGKTLITNMMRASGDIILAF